MAHKLTPKLQTVSSVRMCFSDKCKRTTQDMVKVAGDSMWRCRNCGTASEEMPGPLCKDLPGPEIKAD